MKCFKLFPINFLVSVGTTLSVRSLKKRGRSELTVDIALIDTTAATFHVSSLNLTFYCLVTTKHTDVTAGYERSTTAQQHSQTAEQPIVVIDEPNSRDRPLASVGLMQLMADAFMQQGGTALQLHFPPY